MSRKYPPYTWMLNADGSTTRNYYGSPIIAPEFFMGEHQAGVPVAAGMPPWCTCGWTRHQNDGTWYELADHLADMAAEPDPFDEAAEVDPAEHVDDLAVRIDYAIGDPDAEPEWATPPADDQQGGRDGDVV